jgi:hypothetical protein
MYSRLEAVKRRAGALGMFGRVLELKLGCLGMLILLRRRRYVRRSASGLGDF